MKPEQRSRQALTVAVKLSTLGSSPGTTVCLDSQSFCLFIIPVCVQIHKSRSHSMLFAVTLNLVLSYTRVYVRDNATLKATHNNWLLIESSLAHRVGLRAAGSSRTGTERLYWRLLCVRYANRRRFKLVRPLISFNLLYKRTVCLIRSCLFSQGGPITAIGNHSAFGTGQDYMNDRYMYQQRT